MSTGTNKERILQNNSLVNNNNTKISNISVKVNKLSGLSKTEYDACLEIADSIEIGVDYSGTTATADDILEGKIAYANGERLVGTLKENNSNATLEGSIGAGAWNGPAGITKLITKIDAHLSTGTDASYAFRQCEKLVEIPKNLNTSNAKNMSNMFLGCKSLVKVEQTETCLNTNKATNMTSMFQACDKLTTISDLYLPELQTMNSMFKYSGNLTTIGRLYVPKLTDLTEMFWNNTYLRNLGGWIDLGKGYTQKTEYYAPYTLALTTSTNITYESLMNVINGLYDLNLTYDVANGGTLYRQKLELTSTCKNRLSAEDIAIAEAKGWTVV